MLCCYCKMDFSESIPLLLSGHFLSIMEIRVTSWLLVATSVLLHSPIPCNSGYIAPGPEYRCPSHTMLLSPCTCDSESDEGITVSCKNTNLASMSVGLNNLATFKLPIQRLTLYHCNFGKNSPLCSLLPPSLLLLDHCHHHLPVI